MTHRTLTILGGCIAAALHAQAFGGATRVAAQPFAVLGDSTVTNAGSTFKAGDRGAWPRTAITDVPPGIAYVLMHINVVIAQPVQSDTQTAFVALADVVSSLNGAAQDLGGITLTASALSFDASAQLTGTLMLGTETPALSAIVAEANATLTMGDMIFCGPAIPLKISHERHLSSNKVMPLLVVPAPPAAAMGLVGCSAMCLMRRRKTELSAR